MDENPFQSPANVSDRSPADSSKAAPWWNPSRVWWQMPLVLLGGYVLIVVVVILVGTSLGWIR